MQVAASLSYAQARASRIDVARYTQAARGVLVDSFKNLWPAYILASVLILVGITWALPGGQYVDKSFQADENAAVWAVQNIGFPLYYPRWLRWGTGLFYQVYLFKSAVTLGGIISASDAFILVAGRLVVFGSALGAITLVFNLGRRLFDAWTGRLAAVILAVLPGFVINSHYYKTDVPMTCWALATLLAAFWVMSSPRPMRVAALGLLVGYTASMKYSGAILYPSGLVALVLACRSAGLSVPWKAYTGFAAAGFALGEPWWVNVPGVLEGIGFVASNNTLGIPYVLARPPALIDYPLDVLPYALTTPMLIATGVSLVFVTIKSGWRLAPIWVFLGVYYALLANDNARLVRYTVPFLPFAALFIAYTIRSVARLRFGLPVAMAAAGGLVVYAFVFSLSYVRVMAETDPRVQASQWIEQHVPRGTTFATSTTHYLDIPQLALNGDDGTEVDRSIEKLRATTSTYLILSDFGTLFYQEALDYYPAERQFFEYVRTHYREDARFENSQELLGIDSKSGPHLPQDWLHPNPRITILERMEEADAAPASN